SYQNPTSFQNYSQDQYIRPQGSALNQQSEFNQPYSTRAHYPPYVSDIERGYSNNNIGQGNSGNQDIYNRYSANQPVGTYSSGSASGIRCTYSTASQGHSNNSQQQTVSSQQTTSLTQSTSGNTYSSSQDYYRQDQIVLETYCFLLEEALRNICFFFKHPIVTNNSANMHLKENKITYFSPFDPRDRPLYSADKMRKENSDYERAI
ncbi:hypothetical protein TSAR_013069, partial [Trichomalopsis sarcophagae]